MSKFKVAVCAGHGGSGSTPGKRTPDGEYEWNFNDVVVRAGIALLKANGVDVLRTDDATGKTDFGLTSRTNNANSWGADVYWSAHHNAMGTQWVNHEIGIETFTQNGSNPESEKLASIVHPKYVKAMGLKDRGVKKADLAITRQTKMPAILTEGGFMDSKVDIKKMRDNSMLQAQGEAIAIGILEYLGVKNIKTPNGNLSPAPTPSTGSRQISKPSKKWIEVTGNWNGSPLLENGHFGNPVKQLQAMLEDHGYLASSQVDEYFGDVTESALKKAQKDFGIKVDGLAGKDSYRVLSKSGENSSSKSNKKFIKDYQNWLNKYTSSCNFKKLTVDGVYGKLSKNASTRVYQYLAGTSIDGIFGKNSKSKAPLIMKGSSKTSFNYLLQGLLYCHGLNPKGFDGVIGGGSDTAIRQFQKNKSLLVDGKVGSNTWEKLLE
ncbi:N-acetylmuramoyl-L-alanine amidase [Oceanobacillus kimchii]|uniref:MurNAc-LAA domain-containing protein n=1 Tax=Oceanobacillus kimchii TaxID=746691 RepID=A0ABQ5TNI6_9BACI|nr:N-acetylmuramoyl-L-alanine amidase [Oceanobacillus kimchii]GLO66117.1 hypothetical protein MACH08_19010 [Oceanobacillus kimchii]